MPARREIAQKLGELLAARGKLDRAGLLDALRQQRAHGGRLGTCLLELGAVSEEDLLDALSGQLRLPFVEADTLRSIPAEALRLVPQKIAAARCAVPIRASSTQLTVAMLDPHDLSALDELAFVSGRRIRPHVALEVRLQEALSRSYGCDIPSRFERLIDRLNRARFLWKAENNASTATVADDVAAPLAAPQPAVPASPYPEPPSPRAVDGESRESTASGPRWEPPPVLHALPRPATATPPPTEPAASPVAPSPASQTPASEPAPLPEPPTFDRAMHRLQESTERDEVADSLLDFLRPRVELGLLLMVRKDRATGWSASGIESARLSDLSISLRQPSVVHALVDGAPLHRGPLSALSGNQPLHDLLGRDVSDLLALPIRVGKRLVAVLIAASRSASLSAELSEELQQLAVAASSALAQIVLRRKRRKG